MRADGDGAHVPIRTCVGCGRKAPRAELVRVVREAEGRAAVDARACRPGRGAWLCGPGCVARAAPRLARALRAPLRVELDALRAAVAAALRSGTRSVPERSGREGAS